MIDREVGELWRELPLAGNDSASYWQQKCNELIQKLVGERARNKRLQRMMEDCGHYTYPIGQASLDRSVNEEILARRDFDIPNETT